MIEFAISFSSSSSSSSLNFTTNAPFIRPKEVFFFVFFYLIQAYNIILRFCCIFDQSSRNGFPGSSVKDIATSGRLLVAREIQDYPSFLSAVFEDLVSLLFALRG